MATYTLVEDLSTDDTMVLVEDRTYPAPSIVEDPDGIRLLLLLPGTREIGVRVWQQAHAAGAAMLVAVEDQNLYSVQTTEEFLDRRTDTDHGHCAGHPDLQKACDAAGIKPIFGMEAYLVPDRHKRRMRDWYVLPTGGRREGRRRPQARR
jgi:hypothetical protein